MRHNPLSDTIFFGFRSKISTTPVNCGKYYVSTQHRKLNKTRNTIVSPVERNVSALPISALIFH